MLATKIPYLHCRNGIYYYRNQSTWKSLRTRCKKEAFRKVSHILFGTTPAENSTQQPIAKPAIPSTEQLIKAYLKENGDRWCIREFKRVNSALGFLPSGFITRDIAIKLKATILKVKTVTTFNRYLKYFNASPLLMVPLSILTVASMIRTSRSSLDRLTRLLTMACLPTELVCVVWFM